MKIDQSIPKNNFTNNSQNLQRTIAIWAFSESALGGILHALTIPLRGLFISSAAVLFISLIALFSKSSREILKTTMIVILIKAVVSPYSPLTAYFAVLVQGVLGFLLFSTKKFYKLSALLLGMFALFFSGAQKIITLTIVFGNTLWNSIDIFIRQTAKEFLNIEQPEINYSYLIIAVYILIHLSAGLFIGLYSGRLPQKINYYKSVIPSSIEFENTEEIALKVRRKKRKWFLRPTGVLIIVLSIGVIIISYLSPELDNNAAVSVVIMFLRAIVITFTWYTLLGPLARKYFLKFIAKRKSEYSKDLEEIISMFPQFRKVVNYCWKNSVHKRGMGRIRTFFSTSFYYLLLSK